MQPQKRRPALTAPAPSMYLDERAAESSARLADDYGNRFLNHWFVEAQAKTALPELKALAQILRCNAEDWGREEFASNCIKTALGLSKQMEYVWPGIYQLAALIKERGYYTQDIESWEQKKTLPGKATFEAWFTTYIHPSFEAFARMEEEYKLAEQTGSPIRPIRFEHGGDRRSEDFKRTNGALETGQQVRAKRDGGNSHAALLHDIERHALETGSQQALTLLEVAKADVKKARAVAQQLGLRLPTVVSEVTPELHKTFVAYAKQYGMTKRAVIEEALTLLFIQKGLFEADDFDELDDADTVAPAPTPDPAPAANGFGGLLGDVLQSGFTFQGMSEPEPAPAHEGAEAPHTDEEAEDEDGGLPPTDELDDTPLQPRRHSRQKKVQPPAPEIEDGTPVTLEVASLVVKLSRQTLVNRTKAAEARGDAEVWIPSPDRRYAGIRKSLRAEHASWRVYRSSDGLLDEGPRRIPAERHEIDEIV